MTTPNQQIPPQGQFRPGMQPTGPVMMNNRPPMMQQQGNIRPPPPNLMNQQQPMVRPGFSPYRPSGKEIRLIYYTMLIPHRSRATASFPFAIPTAKTFTASTASQYDETSSNKSSY